MRALFGTSARKWWALVGVIALVAVAGWYVRPQSGTPFRLGLDLRGGTHLIYEADTSAIKNRDVESAMAGIRDVIERRVNALGVAEPLVQVTDVGGRSRLIIELAGVYDTDAAIAAIGATPVLEFRERRTDAPTLSAEQQAKLDAANAEAKQRAEELLAQVRSLPKESLAEKFAALARERSEDPGSANDDGDLNWFRRGAMVPEFDTAAFEVLDVDEVSDALVETDFGWHILWKTGAREVEAAAGATISGITAIGESGQPVNVDVDTGDGDSAATRVLEARVSHILVRKTYARDILGLDADWARTPLGGEQLDSAYVSFDPATGEPNVALEFNAAGAALLEEISARNVDKPIGIFIDGRSPIDTTGDGVVDTDDLYAPTVQEKLTGGSATITGSLTVERAKTLASNLQAGALPVPISILAQTTVGPTLGKASVNASVRAALVGFALVALFMLAYYRFPAIAAVLALACYGVLTLATLKALGSTLTLAGIAGFVMSIGMAVDANVLVLERLREELRRGRSLLDAISVAFSRAWLAIRDSNATTLIAAFILASFSSSVVKGFAITLAVGVLVSMLSAMLITRTFLDVLAGKGQQSPARYGVRRGTH